MLAGMLNKTQWTQVPIGASGSSTIRAKDFVPAGGSFQARAGEMFFPMQEYFAGMDCPFTNASLVNVRAIFASVAGISDGMVGWDGVGDSGTTGDSRVAVPEGVHDAIMMASRMNSNSKTLYLMRNPLFLLHRIA